MQKRYCMVISEVSTEAHYNLSDFRSENNIREVLCILCGYSAALYIEYQQARQCINLLQPTGHVMHLQFKIQQLYVLPTLYFMSFVFI